MRLDCCPSESSFLSWVTGFCFGCTTGESGGGAGSRLLGDAGCFVTWACDQASAGQTKARIIKAAYLIPSPRDMVLFALHNHTHCNDRMIALILQGNYIFERLLGRESRSC